MKKNRKTMRALLYQFGCIEPGEVASMEKIEEGARRLSRVVINPSSYDRGVRFAGIAAGAFTYEVAEGGNSVALPEEVIGASVPIKLFLANHGERAVYPSAAVVMEVL